MQRDAAAAALQAAQILALSLSLSLSLAGCASRPGTPPGPAPPVGPSCSSCPVDLPLGTPSAGDCGPQLSPASDCAPGWCTERGTGDNSCAADYPQPKPEISDYAMEGVTMACAGVHDPTHLIYAEGFLTVFGSGQSELLVDGTPCGHGIAQKYMAPNSNVWQTRITPMFGGTCSGGSNDATSYPHIPPWLRRKASGTSGCAMVDGSEVCDIRPCNVGNSGETLCDFDAPTVHYSAEAKFTDKQGTLRHWVMYYSAYIKTPDVTGIESGGQACIGRATATGNPDALVWTDDDRPVYCSNVAYNENGFPSTARFDRNEGEDTPETEYVRAVDDGYGIDPELHYGDDGTTLYMTWGSGTINAVELGSDGHVIAAGQLTGDTQEQGFAGGLGPGKQSAGDTATYPVISRGSGDSIFAFNEAPYVYKYSHEGTMYYYLFVNWHSCCAAACSKYEIMVGRSVLPSGGFEDREGNPMGTMSSGNCQINGMTERCAGGTKVLVGKGRYVGPGHAGVFEYTSNSAGSLVRVFTFHYYDNYLDGAMTEDGQAARGGAKLGAREMTFDEDGWPVISETPWDVCDLMGCDGGSVSNTCPNPASGDQTRGIFF